MAMNDSTAQCRAWAVRKLYTFSRRNCNQNPLGLKVPNPKRLRRHDKDNCALEEQDSQPVNPSLHVGIVPLSKHLSVHLQHHLQRRHGVSGGQHSLSHMRGCTAQLSKHRPMLADALRAVPSRTLPLP